MTAERDVLANSSPDTAPSRAELEGAHCWEAEDDLPRRPAMTAFRRRARLHQARWREGRGHPIGTQPYRPRPDAPTRLVGSRIPLEFAHETGANFLTADAWAAARERTDHVERHQTLDRQRLWADLLSSEALAFNLFGDLAADHGLAGRAVRAWWPDAPGTVAGLRFEHSPGRLDPAYLNSLRRFDAAILLDRGDGTRGIVAIDTNYHEKLHAAMPRPENLWRYVEVATRAGIFRPGAVDRLQGRSPLAVTWLEHLLLHSMLQHESGRWTWGRYVVVHPAGNPDLAQLVDDYRSLLEDPTTFAAVTLEDLLDEGVLRPATTTLLRERYVPD